MKKVIAFSLLGLLMFVSIASAQTAVFTNSEKHYSFELPEGWEQIPDEVLTEYEKALSQISPGNVPDYKVSFQYSERNYLEHPYILLQEYDVDTPSYSEILKSFDQAALDAATEELDTTTEIISNATIDKPYVDQERNILFMNMTMDVAGVGNVHGLVAMFLGREGITQLNFYTLSEEDDQFMPVFNSIIDSFKYESGYEYDEEEAKKNDEAFASEIKDTESSGSGILSKAIIGGVIGAIAGLIAALITKKKKQQGAQPGKEASKDDTK